MNAAIPASRRLDLVVIAATALCLPLGIWAFHRTGAADHAHRAWILLPLTTVPTAASYVIAFRYFDHGIALCLATVNALGLVGIVILQYWTRGNRIAGGVFATAAVTGVALIAVLARVVVFARLDDSLAWIVLSFGAWLLGLFAVASATHAPRLSH
jgi:hypothetical protein